MKKLLGIVLFIFLISCLNRQNDIKKNNGVYYFMFEKSLSNNPDSSSKSSDKHEFINDDYDDTVAINDELRNYTHSQIVFLKRIDSIKAVGNYTDETFYKRVYDSTITYIYKHRFLIGEYEDAHVTYGLSHNIGFDTMFIKHEAFLDSINVINNGTFLEDVENGSTLWQGSPMFLKDDTLNIFVIERILNTDSCIFRKVNRYLLPWL